MQGHDEREGHQSLFSGPAWPLPPCPCPATRGAHLQPIDAIGDDAEVVAPHRLLAAVEHGVVCAHQLQHAARQRRPQRRAVLPVARVVGGNCSMLANNPTDNGAGLTQLLATRRRRALHCAAPC